MSFNVRTWLMIFAAVRAQGQDNHNSDAGDNDVVLLQQSLEFQDHALTSNQDLETSNQSAVTGSKILMVGDSNAAHAGGNVDTPSAIKAIIGNKNTLQMNCPGSTVFNEGLTASKISQWSDEGYDRLKTALGVSTGWTHVWVSLGANDLGQMKCSDPQKKVKTDLTNLIAEIHKLHPNAKVVLTSYAVGALDDTCTVEQVRANVYVAMEEIAKENPKKVIFSSMAAAARGELDPTKRTKCYNGLFTSGPPDWADPAQGKAPRKDDGKAKDCTADCAPEGKCCKLVGVPPCRGLWSMTNSMDSKVSLLSDGGHLNVAGYKRAWEVPDMQKAFGCGKKGSSPLPSPTTPTQSPPGVNCADNDAGLEAYAKKQGNNVIKTCATAKQYCGMGDVNGYCRTTCNVGSCR